ncbi:MAG: RHS repeat protein [Candidatus Omnitrophica bacterium]|nr:RHS repeat protein [Candidatus Omnitrophota bacterium]
MKRALYGIVAVGNNQGLLITASNEAGDEQSITYDVNDHPTSATDANGVTVIQTFDRMGRLLTRTYPDTDPEGFGYSLSGLTAYTNANGKVTPTSIIPRARTSPTATTP